MFIALVARSGGGKGAAIAVGQEALEVHGNLLRVARANLGSGEGISAAFVGREKNDAGNTEIVQHTDSVLFEVPEVDTFGAVSSRTGSTLAPEVRKMWSGEALGFQNRDVARSLPVEAHTYRAAMIVGVQPTRSGALLNDADGGTPQRFLWMPATDPDAPTVAPQAPMPLRWQMPGTDVLPATGGGRRVIKVCDAATSAIDSAQIARLRGEGDALDGHALFSRLKVAAALALLDGRGEVSEDDWNLAGTVMDVSDETRRACKDALRDAARAANEARAEARAEASVVSADHAEIMALSRAKDRILSKVTDEWLAASVVRKAITRSLREHFSTAVDELVSAGSIEAQETEYQGQKSLILRLATSSAVTKPSPLSSHPSDPHDSASFRGGTAAVTESSPLQANRHLTLVDAKEATGS